MLKTIRRDLHQIPELELQLPETKAYLLKELAGLADEVYEMSGSDSFVLYFDNDKPQTIAFRSDMDALPIHEENTHGFISRHPGKMHACGHDGHMAVLSTFAHWLADYRDQLDVNAALIFQAGEESPGGARLVVEDGILSRLNTKAVYGLHIWPSLKPGLYTTGGEMMASSKEVTITVHGKSVHASRYRQGIDAMEIAARLLLEIYKREKELDPDKRRLLRFGSLHSGSACNVVADQAELYGTLRTYDLSFMKEIQDEIARIARNLEEETGAGIEIRYSNGYPPLLNDPDLAAFAFEKLPYLQELEEPDMASEDFSYYGTSIPSLFFFLGVDEPYPLHSDRFNFDEKHLEKGVQLYIDLLKAASELEKSDR